MIEVVEVLRAGRELLIDPACICRGDDALDAGYAPAHPASKDACYWCSQGALLRVTSSEDERAVAGLYLDTAVQQITGNDRIDYIAFHDSRGHASVIAMWDLALSLAVEDRR